MTTSTKPGPGSFAARVRDVLRERGLTLAHLSEQAEIDPSLVSRLLSESPGSRREPRPEHVIAFARVLRVGPSDLVLGTDAEAALAEWIPRAELAKEIDERVAAQKAASDARTAAASARAEASTYRAQVDGLSREQTRLNDDLARERAAHARAARDQEAKIAALRGELAAVTSERDAERERANQNYRSWSTTNSALEGARRTAATAAGVAVFTSILGIGAVAAAASSDDDQHPPPAPRRRRR